MDIYKIDLSSGKLFGEKNPTFENDTEDESKPTETLEIKLRKNNKKDSSNLTQNIIFYQHKNVFIQMFLFLFFRAAYCANIVKFFNLHKHEKTAHYNKIG